MRLSLDSSYSWNFGWIRVGGGMYWVGVGLGLEMVLLVGVGVSSGV